MSGGILSSCHQQDDSCSHSDQILWSSDRVLEQQVNIARSEAIWHSSYDLAHSTTFCSTADIGRYMQRTENSPTYISNRQNERILSPTRIGHTYNRTKETNMAATDRNEHFSSVDRAFFSSVRHHSKLVEPDSSIQSMYSLSLDVSGKPDLHNDNDWQCFSFFSTTTDGVSLRSRQRKTMALLDNDQRCLSSTSTTAGDGSRRCRRSSTTTEDGSSFSTFNDDGSPRQRPTVPLFRPRQRLAIALLDVDVHRVSTTAGDGSLRCRRSSWLSDLDSDWRMQLLGRLWSAVLLCIISTTRLALADGWRSLSSMSTFIDNDQRCLSLTSTTAGTISTFYWSSGTSASAFHYHMRMFGLFRVDRTHLFIEITKIVALEAVSRVTIVSRDKKYRFRNWRCGRGWWKESSWHANYVHCGHCLTNCEHCRRCYYQVSMKSIRTVDLGTIALIRLASAMKANEQSGMPSPKEKNTFLGWAYVEYFFFSNFFISVSVSKRLLLFSFNNFVYSLNCISFLFFVVVCCRRVFCLCSELVFVMLFVFTWFFCQQFVWQ